MTTRIPERLKFDEQSLSMCTEPLGAYFAAAGKHFKFADTCPALWRGYVGSCEIVEDRLYLGGIDAIGEDGSGFNGINDSNLYYTGHSVAQPPPAAKAE